MKEHFKDLYISFRLMASTKTPSESSAPSQLTDGVLFCLETFVPTGQPSKPAYLKGGVKKTKAKQK